MAQSAPRARILVVDDEPLKRITLQIELTEAGFEVSEAVDAASAERIFDSQPIDVVVSDVRMPGLGGLDLLARFRQRRPEVDVILMTAYATVETAVLAIKRGAYDYITKPFTTADLIAKLEALLTGRPPRSGESGPTTFGPFSSRNIAMIQLFARLREAAESGKPLLLHGERGVGKRALAEAVVAAGPRAGKPQNWLSCGGQAEAALEAEWFGLERGSPGAARGKAGALAQLDGGTALLLDIEQLPPGPQQRLLRVIETGELNRPGAPAHKADLRIIAVTRADLEARLRAGEFRDDLYYKLAVLSLRVPPLRERPDDLGALARRFLDGQPRGPEQRPLTLTSHAIEELARYSWPGNLRELEHVLERAAALCRGDEIRPEHIAPLTRNPSEAPAALELVETGPSGLQETVADIERRMILMALRQCGGNQARAAQRLGIPRTTLRDKMAKYCIPMG